MLLFTATPQGVQKGMCIVGTNGTLHVPLMESPHGDTEACLRVTGFEPETIEITRASLLPSGNGEPPTLGPESPEDRNSTALVLIRVPVQPRVDRPNRPTTDIAEYFVDMDGTTTRVTVIEMRQGTKLSTPYYDHGGAHNSLRICWDGKNLAQEGHAA